LRPEELELLVCGDAEEIDIDDLEHATAYQHYNKETTGLLTVFI